MNGSARELALCVFAHMRVESGAKQLRDNAAYLHQFLATAAELKFETFADEFARLSRAGTLGGIGTQFYHAVAKVYSFVGPPVKLSAISVDSQACHVALDACAAAGCIKRGTAFIWQSRTREEIHAITCNALLEVFVVDDDLAGAWAALDVEAVGLHPNNITFNMIINLAVNGDGLAKV